MSDIRRLLESLDALSEQGKPAALVKPGSLPGLEGGGVMGGGGQVGGGGGGMSAGGGRPAVWSSGRTGQQIGRAHV